MKKKRSLSYKEAGVDIDKGDEFVKRIGNLVKKTYRKEVLPSLSGFGGLFSLEGYKRPILVSSTDGVGTKLLIASLLGRYKEVGVDLVAMNVNDVLAMGARPLFFLDYIASAKIDPEVGEKIIEGIVEGCREGGCSLLGGETAEMPDFYARGQYELVGFAVGVVEEDNIVDGSRIKPGDKIFGLPSSGLHSNGFSLVRRILFGRRSSKDEKIRILLKKEDKLGKSWGDEILTPTRIYVKPILSLFEKRIKVTGLAHITGGGIVGNIKRILPEGCRARIFSSNWRISPVFSILCEKGNIEEEEMWRVFNMGVGMAVVVCADEEEKVLSHFKERQEDIYLIGDIVRGERKVIVK